MKLLFVSLALVFGFFLFYSCHERGPLFPDPALGLGLRDFSCTEAWIEVQVGNNDKTANIYIKKDDEIIKTITLGQSDSIFYFDNLQPNTSYKFDAVTYDDGKEIKSNPVTFTTLDTTSHNFTWHTFTFGETGAGGSTLYDVAIINENDIWAVGEIYMNDSLGNSISYNAAHWDGSTWELKRILYKGGFWVIRTIFAFNENDIWFSGYMRYLNGNYIELPIPNILMGWSINKLWGSNSNDLYAVGNSGNIAHFNDSGWTKIESGTTTDILDIWGRTDAITSEASVYCAVSYVFQNGDSKILRIKNSKVDSLSWFGDKRINSVWTPNNRVFYSAGDGVFENKNNFWNQIVGLPPFYSDNIRGNGLNDIFVCGDFGLLSHFNGLAWVTYNEHYMQGILFSVAIKNNTIVTVGLKGNKAIVIKGERN